MSAARRLPVISSILAAGFAIAAGSNSSVRATVARFTGLSAPGGTWRAIAIILAILNIKNLPLVWHVCYLCPTTSMDKLSLITL